jgi:hypothetical protein
LLLGCAAILFKFQFVKIFRWAKVSRKKQGIMAFTPEAIARVLRLPLLLQCQALCLFIGMPPPCYQLAIADWLHHPIHPGNDDKGKVERFLIADLHYSSLKTLLRVCFYKYFENGCPI